MFLSYNAADVGATASDVVGGAAVGVDGWS